MVHKIDTAGYGHTGYQPGEAKILNSCSAIFVFHIQIQKIFPKVYKYRNILLV